MEKCIIYNTERLMYREFTLVYQTTAIMRWGVWNISEVCERVLKSEIKGDNQSKKDVRA